MPELYFKGKEFVYNHHLSVPFRPLIAHPDKSVGERSENMIIHGDNLHALKALLPRFAGKVDCIYIDPPYNTGEENWSYNDNVNSPIMKEWLDSNPVNKEDMLRHDKWACMMYPRLKLLGQLMAESGVIFISIDDNELYHLRVLLDEVFGDTNWVGTIVWKNVTDNNPTNIATEHEYIVSVAKDKLQIESIWKSKVSDIKSKLVEVGESFIKKYEDRYYLQAAYTKWFRQNKNYLWPLDRYKYIDKDGIYTGSQSVHNPGREGYRYAVYHPKTGQPCKEPLMGYRFPPETMDELLKQGRVIFGKDHNKIIELKVYAHEYEDKLPSVINLDGRLGAYELREIFPEAKKVFNNPKPTQVLIQILSFTTGGNSLVLDSFAGSGTTAHSVLELNRQDDGNRRFILVECEDYAESITAERVKRVISGKSSANSEKLRDGLGGDFTFYTLGEPLDIDKILTGESLPDYTNLGGWLFHTATGETLDETLVNETSWYLGSSRSYHVWLIYKPDRDFLKSRDAALTLQLAQKIGETHKDKPHLVFAPAKFVPNKMILPLGVEYAPLPFALYRFEKD